MPIQFEFDPLNKILLLELMGGLQRKLLGDAYRAICSYLIATVAASGIFDLSGVTNPGGLGLSPSDLRSAASTTHCEPTTAAVLLLTDQFAAWVLGNELPCATSIVGTFA